MSDCVYLIVVNAPDEGRGELYKVGVSADPRARLASLATACPYPLRLLSKWRYPSRAIAFEIERDFHQANARYRLNLEWFRGPVIGAWCGLDSAALFYLVETRGLRIADTPLALRHMGVSDDTIPDLIGSHYGNPPYEDEA